MSGPRHRVLLVREWDDQTSGSGCCGRLDGLHSELGDTAAWAHNRCHMESMGAVYRALRASLPPGDVDLTVVDPRNMVWLLPAIWRDARRSGMAAGHAWRQLVRGTTANAIVVDGKVLFAGQVPAPEEAVAAIRTELADRT
jgi:hypothetical protein